jgi:two-component system, NtrC family, response regulator AtoC
MRVTHRNTNDSSPEGRRNMTFPTAAAKNRAVARVLVVDDEPLIRWSLAETLTRRRHVVTEAGDAKTTLRILKCSSERPDVVLLDYRLPDSNDLRLFAAIKRQVPEIQIILMTAYGTSDIATEALALGAYRVVGKPFEVEDLAMLVHEAHACRRL